jgi:hypothetical protein
MHPEIKKYLDQMCREISNKTARKNARLEIENHLLDQVEALHLPEDEAVRRVLKEATPPAKLGTKLNLAHRPFMLRYPRTFAYSSLTIMAMLTVIIMSHILVKDFFLPQLKANFEPAFETKFQEDLEIIASTELLKASTRLKNAYPFVMAKVGFENQELRAHHEKIEKLMRKWNVEEKRVGKDSPWKQKHLIDRLMKHKLFKSLDNSWVDDLTQYDHLNYFSSTENEPIFRNATGRSGIKRIYAISGYKLPDFTVMRKSITFRIYEKIQEGKQAEARKILLHSFGLFQSSHSLVGSSIAANLLSTHEKLRTMYSLKWNEIPKRTRLAYRRIGWGWSSVMNSSVSDPDSFAKWKKFAVPEMGVCAGVTESQGANALYADFFEEKAPLETDLGDLVSKSKAILSSMNRICGLTEFSRLLDSELIEKDSFFDQEYLQGFYHGPHNLLSQIPINPSRIPYVRRMFGMFLMTVAMPRFHSVYLMKEDPEV